MAQLPHFESRSLTHEGEGTVTATEGEWAGASDDPHRRGDRLLSTLEPPIMCV